MTPHDLQILVDYHYWAIERALAAIETLPLDHFTRDLGGSFASVRDTLAHMQGAEWIWLERFHGRAPSRGLSPERFPDLASARAAWAETERDLRELVEHIDDQGITRVFPYRLLNGQTGESRVGDTVQHLVNHGTYHRGQLTTMLRQLGAAPPASTDYIAYLRLQAARQ